MYIYICMNIHIHMYIYIYIHIHVLIYTHKFDLHKYMSNLRFIHIYPNTQDSPVNIPIICMSRGQTKMERKRILSYKYLKKKMVRETWSHGVKSISATF